MADTSEPSDTPPVVSTGTVDESTLLPLERDRRFLVRLVLLLLFPPLSLWLVRFVG